MIRPSAFYEVHAENDCLSDSNGRCVQQLCISVLWIQDIPLSIGVRSCVTPCRSRVATKEGAPIDLHRSRAAKSPSFGPLAGGFVRPKKSPFSLKRGLRSDDQSDWQVKKQRRAVGSVSPHQSAINIRQPMPPRAHRRKQNHLLRN